MRSTFRRLLTAALLFASFSAFAFAESPVALTLNGAPVQSDVAPVIAQGRTLVPVRAVFEALGADVQWDPQQRQVCVSYSQTEVLLTVDDPVVKVNGQENTMEVPARILPGGRVFIPVRFAAEALGFFVDWDPESRTVILETPKPERTVINNISISSAEGAAAAQVTFSGSEPVWKTAAYEGPDRFVVNIQNARLDMGAVPGGSGSLPSDNGIFSQIRYAQFDADTVRIVFDLLQRQTGMPRLDSAASLLFVEFALPGGGETPAEEPDPPLEEEGEEEDIWAKDIQIPALDWRMAGRQVVVDAGHGGKDPGCLVIDGSRTLHEKDFNLATALALEKYLAEAGLSVHMLRRDDRTLGLQERPVLANQTGADLYVSIHNNAANTAVPKGTQIFYYAKSSEDGYVLGSKSLANSIMEEFLLHVGLADRGVLSQSAYAVLNKTRMPAVIVEGGFFSNPEDRQVMLRPDYPDRYARTVARAIVLCLNRAAEDQGGLT